MRCRPDAVGPATADLLSRLATGRADDLLTTLVLATRAAVFVAPAMNNAMWDHPATQRNVSALTDRGVSVLGPDSGEQACGEFGPGRMREPIVQYQLLMLKIQREVSMRDYPLLG